MLVLPGDPKEGGGGQGAWWNAAKHRLFLQRAGDCSVEAETGRESRQVIGITLHRIASCWVKTDIASDVITTQSQCGSSKPHLSSGHFPAL